MKSLSAQGIEYKQFDETLIATIRTEVTKRQEIDTIVKELAENLPKDSITGPAFCIFHYFTGTEPNLDVEAGFPVNQNFESGRIKSRMLPEISVLSIMHKGSLENISESRNKLITTRLERGIISDEFSREIFVDSNNPDGKEIEIHLCIHNWNKLFADSIERVLGGKTKRDVISGTEKISEESSLQERVCWVRDAIGKLTQLADEDQQYEIISKCAHIFPQAKIDKTRTIYQNALAQVDDPIKAIDAVLECIETDPAWAGKTVRQGAVIYGRKNPANPEAYEKATTEIEKRKAACYCPLLKNNLEIGMPDAFCNCGAGYSRQLWEGILGRPVKIDIVKSVLCGDLYCEFAVHIPKELLGK